MWLSLLINKVIDSQQKMDWLEVENKEKARANDA